ncbi:type II secretion system F family protein [Ornithinimicrobium cryptoxanthini]|uniref:type II secretion system F family protein n=1 Tax=Ornithinimicrobium cryptoxanthini TaxID=2934161 RepID=UPI00211840E1|nr:type II secretion system F family protein [Ornithinimicrobium cryptoxanthini]
MTGSFLGLVLGLGLACIWWSFWPAADPVRKARHHAILAQLDDDIRLAGLRSLRWPGLLAVCAIAVVIVAVLGLAVTRVPAVSIAFAGMAGWAPLAVVRARARSRRSRLREVWPDAVDHISSGVRAGLSLPEALIQLGDRGPEELREAFLAFGHDYRASGRFTDSLDQLKERMADPVADRLVEALRLAREVGGSDLGKVLRTLSTFLREDARSRAELEARQSWTVNAARLAMCAPWIVLLLMATRGTALQAYREPTGVVILIIGGVLSIVAYQAMVRIGRLPVEHRVLR